MLRGYGWLFCAGFLLAGWSAGCNSDQNDTSASDAINTDGDALDSPTSGSSDDIVESTATATETATATTALVEIDPAVSELGTSQTLQFSTSGGTEPYTYSVYYGSGSIDATIGLFTSPARAGAEVIRVTDAEGNFNDAIVTVSDPLDLLPIAGDLGFFQSIGLEVSGGFSPYTFTVDGPAIIDASTGWLTTEAENGTVVVTVEDSAESTTTASFAVSSTGLSITPSPGSVDVESTLTLSASGGTSPYTYSIISGTGSLDSSTGVYTPLAVPGTAILRASDAAGNSVDTAIKIESDTLTITPATATIAIGSSQIFTVTGGIPPRTDLSILSGGGTLDTSTGEYTPDGSSDSVTIGISDLTGSTAQASISVVMPVKVLVGRKFACALFNSGAVRCWGYNSDGQLGRGNTTSYGDGTGEMGSSLPEVDLGTDLTVQALSVGFEHACAILSDQTVQVVKCWGNNASGQLGQGDTDDRGDGADEMGDSLLAIDLGTNSSGADHTATALCAAEYHTCALLAGGSVKCWGRNDYGQLGLGDTVNRGDSPDQMGNSLSAIDLGSGRTSTSIACGAQHTCAILDDASLKCWGKNDQGQLGQGDINSRGDGTPTGGMGDALAAISLGTNSSAENHTVTAVSGGTYHTCAILEDGSLKCFGDGSVAQLGIGSTDDYGNTSGTMGDLLPVALIGEGLTVTSVEVGNYFTCALLSSGALKCWGLNTYGGLGQGSTDTLGDSPTELGDNMSAIDLGADVNALTVSAGAHFACALLNGYRIKCWGYNAEGQLGLEDTDNRGDATGEMGDALDYVEF